MGAHLGLQISMNVSKLVEFINGGEHFTYVKASVYFLEDARIIEKRPEIASRDIFHGQVNKMGILKRIE